jgi:sec-independent protein translocase protein TatA
MPFNLGPTELIIILVIIVVLFGAGRISKISGELGLGQGIREFRKGLSSEDKPAEKPEDKEKKA